MTKKSLLAAALGLALLGFGCGPKKPQPAPATPPPAAQKPAPTGTVTVGAKCATMLTATDVETLTGLTPVVTIPKNPQVGAGGDCNYGLDANTPVLMVVMLSKSDFENAKALFGASVKEEAGIGDEAFSAGNYNLYVRKGETAIGLATFFKAGGGQYLTQEQLKIVANFMLGKM